MPTLSKMPRERGRARVDERRSVGHRADDSRPTWEPRLHHRDGNARGDRHDERVAHRGIELREDPVEHLRLGGEHDDVGPAGGLDVVGPDADAVAVAQLVEALAPDVGGPHAVGLARAGAEQALDQRAGHVARADECDALVDLHWFTSCFCRRRRPDSSSLGMV